MRESNESKPKSNSTIRDAISPDMPIAFHVKHQSLRSNDMATSPDVSFQSKETTLTDGSKVYDVILWTVDEPRRLCIANMPSDDTAGQCADMLQRVLGRFLRCGSDKEAVRLAIEIENALKAKL